jgi:nitroreductase
MENLSTSVIDAIIATRSIRKYTERQVPRDVLDRILEAGTHAANAGGGQRTVLVALRDARKTRELGLLNMARFNRGALIGSRVSAEQPSVIDDPTLKDGFYGAPCVVTVFALEKFLFSVADAFACVQTMAYAAHSLGVSSCIVSRAEDTFATPEGARLKAEWGVPDTYQARCFLTLGYCDGAYPAPKPRKPGRVKVVE